MKLLLCVMTMCYTVQSTSLVQPEILVVVDTNLHNRLGGNMNTTKEYVRDFWSAVNQRFVSLSQPRVELVVVGVKVGPTPYLQGKAAVGKDKVEASVALERMGRYYYNEDRTTFDLVVTMTGLDLCGRKTPSSRCRSATAGYAYVGGACVVNSRLHKVNSVAVVQDRGGYGGVVVAAHEVAHLLGVPHDGEKAPSYTGGPGAQSCPWEDGYIMSDRRRGIKGLTWSSCSKSQMKYFLSSPTASCLSSTSRTSSSTLPLLPTPALLSPRVLSPDVQCQREHGAKSRVCSSHTSVCSQLFCLHPDTGRCLSYRQAVEGTLCGKEGYCAGGTCVHTSPVKEGSNDREKKVCKDQQSINIRGVNNCEELFQSFTSRVCNSKRVKKKCCASHKLYCQTVR